MDYPFPDDANTPEKCPCPVPDLQNDKAQMERVLEFVDTCGLSITQVNGQRKLGPPPNWTGPPPSPKCEVFVGKLPRDLDESEIYPIFRRVGEIYEIRLMMDFSGTNRGYCFVMFTNCQDAQKAVHQLNDIEIRNGRRIGVLASINNCRLYVTQLPMDLDTEAFIKKIFVTTSGVEKVAVYRLADNRPKNAIIFYKTHIGAAMARRRLVPERSSFINGAEISIDWAHPNLDPRNVAEESGTIDDDGQIHMVKTFIEVSPRKPWKDGKSPKYKDKVSPESGLLSGLNKKKLNSRRKISSATFDSSTDEEHRNTYLKPKMMENLCNRQYPPSHREQLLQQILRSQDINGNSVSPPHMCARPLRKANQSPNSFPLISNADQKNYMNGPWILISYPYLPHQLGQIFQNNVPPAGTYNAAQFGLNRTVSNYGISVDNNALRLAKIGQPDVRVQASRGMRLNDQHLVHFNENTIQQITQNIHLVSRGRVSSSNNFPGQC